MKKKAKKILLHKETLRNLQSGDLRGIVGGISLRTCTSDACTGTCGETNTSCYTCECTCTVSGSGCPTRLSDCC